MRCVIAISVFALLLAVAACHKVEDEDTQLVTVREIQSELSKRSLSRLPDYLNVEFKVSNEPVNLRLVRNLNIDMNAPVTFEGVKSKRSNIAQVKDSAVYQDVRNMAAISVTAKVAKTGRTKRTLEGSFMVKGKHYGIRAAAEALSLLKTALDKRILHKKADGNLHEVYELKNEKRDLKHDQMKANIHNARQEKLKMIDRKKRATSVTIAAYNVEILMALDHTIWEHFLSKANNDASQAVVDLKYYYSHQMNGMDLAYRTIDAETSGISISLYLMGYHIAKTKADSSWTVSAITHEDPADVTKTVVNAGAILGNIGKWSVEDGRSWTNPDHVILWTRYDVKYFQSGNAYDIVGYAPVAGICSPGSSVSLVEDNGMHSWGIAAHELGHNLGSDHDDSSDNICTADSQYIMAAFSGLTTQDQILNKFMFSSCSAEYMKKTLSGNDQYRWPRVCLTNRVCSHGEPVNTERRYTLDEQCEANYGPGYGLYQYSTLADVCYKLKCSLSGSNYYYYRTPGAAHGSDCGNNKCCLRGQCVDDCSTPDVSTDATCVGTGLPTTVPSGCTDQVPLWYTYNSEPIECTDVVTRFPHLCFTSSYIQPRCCAACHAAGIVQPTQHFEEVTVRELDPDRPIPTLPDSLNVEFKAAGKRVKLRLVRSHIDGDTFKRSNNAEETAAYRDAQKKATISVTAKSSEGKTKRTLEGTFLLDGQSYRIRPLKTASDALQTAHDKRKLHNSSGTAHQVYAE